MKIRANPVDYSKIDFDRELTRGRACYEGKVGRWWHRQALNPSHQRAYRTIGNYLQEVLPRSPSTIVDYACGSGHLLARLPKRFPRSRFLALDGSAYMLKMAQARLNKQGQKVVDRVTFRQTHLPSFSLPRAFADVVVFAFPNIVVASEKQSSRRGPGNRKDRAVARYLSEAREPDPEDETVTDDPETLFDAMMDEKLISRHLRTMLRPGGYCVRVEYSNAHRREFTRLVRQRLAFEEGSLNEPVNGKRAEQIFHYVRSRYFRSRVIEDVFHQTRDSDDLDGGYSITLLKAI